MKGLKNGLSFLLGIGLLSCFQDLNAQEFSLTGKTSSIPDGEIIYLKVDNKPVDSVTVKDQVFVFRTELPYFPISAFIHPKDLRNYSEYRSLWLEENAMGLDAVDTTLNAAIVTGSVTEEENVRLKEETNGLSHKETVEAHKKFIRENPNSIISAHMLAVYSTTFGRDTTEHLFGRFSENNSASVYGQRISRYLELNKNPKIGEAFLDFASETPDGNTRKLSEMEGKLILLEFWASWCGPCREENPNLVKTYERFQPKGFEVFAVSLDVDKHNWTKAIDDDQLPWLHVSDLKGNENEASLVYGVNGIPDNFLIDENGTIIARGLRGEKLNEKLSELLN